jgi:hypothetical protein
MDDRDLKVIEVIFGIIGWTFAAVLMLGLLISMIDMVLLVL